MYSALLNEAEKKGSVAYKLTLTQRVIFAHCCKQVFFKLNKFVSISTVHNAEPSN